MKGEKVSAMLIEGTTGFEVILSKEFKVLARRHKKFPLFKERRGHVEFYPVLGGGGGKFYPVLRKGGRQKFQTHSFSIM